VVGARAAAGLILTVASEVFEESGRTFVRGTLDYLQGLKVCLIASLSIPMLYNY
jgi:E3 ubiquitin-protein ligase MUL1